MMSSRYSQTTTVRMESAMSGESNQIGTDEDSLFSWTGTESMHSSSIGLTIDNESNFESDQTVTPRATPEPDIPEEMENENCQPGRIFEANQWNFPELNGIIITAPLADSTTYKHFVYSDGKLYKMPHKLFQAPNYRGLKTSQILRYEKALKFGDNVCFNANGNNEVIYYEMGQKVYKAECKEGLNLVKTIAVLPPKNKGQFCWTQLFGNIDLNDDLFEKLHLQAKYDVPIYAWISVEIERNGRDWEPKFDFFKFIEVAVDERKIAWEAVLLKLEGFLIDSKELFCPQLKEHRVEIGLWSKSEAKVENNFDLLGNKYRFDAYYNDVLKTYIAYFYEDIIEWAADDEDGEEYEDKECWVIPDDYGTKMLQIQIFPSDNYGILYNTPNFGLIADPLHVLGPLPIFVPEMEVESLWVNVIDTGPGKKMSRFTIARLSRQPKGAESYENTVELIKQAKQMAMEENENGKNRKHKIEDVGFVVDEKYTFFSPKYANQKIVLPMDYRKCVKVGHWIKFEAIYREETNSYEIIGGEPTGQIVPHNIVSEKVDGKEVVKYLFKIEAKIIKNPQNDSRKIFLAGILCNPKYGGLIADPEQKFKKVGRAKNQKLIVESNSEGPTLFKLVRMSNAEEKMDSEQCGVNIYPDDNDTGLELEDELDSDEEKPITQVDLLSEAAIREGKIRKRGRRRQKDKAARLEQEQDHQLILLDENFDEIEPTPSTSAAAV